MILYNDCRERNVTEEESIQYMKKLLWVMQSADENYDADLRSPSNMAGGDGAKLEMFRKKENRLIGDFLTMVMEKAVKMGESNACMKRIVAMPTAGSCGVIPAVLLSYKEYKQVPEEEIIKALYVAGGIGEVIAASASISGAEGGCQAEIGTASAISVNKEYKGTLSESGDDDYYKFTLDADGYIAINFKHASTGDTNNFGTVYLKDKNGNDITSLKSVGTSKSVSSEKCGLKKGTYYLYLNPAYNCTSTPYTMKVSYTKSDNWEKENNGDVSAATKIDLGKDYNGTTRVNGGYDYDYYKFTLEDKTWINISLSHPDTGSTSAQWYADLLDKSGKSISKDANGDYIGGYLSVKGTQTYASMGGAATNILHITAK